MSDSAPSPSGSRRGILLIGNFHSHLRGNAGVIEQVAAGLEQAGWIVSSASRSSGRLSRIADMLWTTWRARTRYRVAQVDVYSGNAFIWAELVCGLLRMLSRPYILMLHGGNLPAFAQQNDQRVRRLFEPAAAVIAPSAYLAEAMAQYSPRSIACLPNSVDLGLYRCEIRTAARPKIVWLRRLHAIYDPAMAIETIVRLKASYPDVHLSMVGAEETPGMMAEMKALAARRGVSANIEFAGGAAKSEVGNWIASGDIFLNTASIDNTPVTLIEAMACGVPVVSTWAGGVPKLVSDGREALLVAPGDAEAMANAVRRLIEDPALCEKLSRNGRAKAEGLDWKRVFPMWEELFERVHGTA